MRLIQLQNFLEIYYEECNELSDNKKNEVDAKYDPKNFFLKPCRK